MNLHEIRQATYKARERVSNYPASKRQKLLEQAHGIIRQTRNNLLVEGAAYEQKSKN